MKIWWTGQAMDFGDDTIVLHGGDGDACVKRYQRPPLVKMVSAGKCFPCHGCHCLCFGELTWTVAPLHRGCKSGNWEDGRRIYFEVLM